MSRVVLPVVALALVAAGAAGCEPPIEKSEFNNSGLSVAIAQDPSVAPPQSRNPPPHIDAPQPAAR